MQPRVHVHAHQMAHGGLSVPAVGTITKINIDAAFFFSSAECDASQLKCKNGQCKAKFWECDGIDDCGDETDEETCGELSPTVII